MIGKMLVVVAALVGSASAQDGGLCGEAAMATTSDEARQLGAPKNHAVCYTIADTWWGTREAQKTRASVTNTDDLCAAWDNQPELCNQISARAGLTGYTAAQLSALCSTVGAHDQRCLANPCNNLNTGDCTLQSTQGQCTWWWGKNFTDYNTFLVSKGLTPLPVHGCYRNPCNMPGYGKQQTACPLRSAEGLFTCTWCQGAGDKVLLGRGVGCQMTVPTTSAGCAPVNSPNVQKSSIMQSIAKNTCQCSMNYAACAQIVNDSRAAFKPRY